MLFAGDFYLDPVAPSLGLRTVATSLARDIAKSSFSVVNFESPIAGYGTPQSKDGPHLASSAIAPALLKALGFNGLLLANNHVADYGMEALRATIREVETCELAYGGVDLGSETTGAVRTVMPGGENVTIFAFCEREFGTNAEGGQGACWLGPNVGEQIAEAKRRGDIVVVCSHGGNELVPLPSLQRRSQMRGLVEMGADLVIGHHSHVAQGWEVWRDSYIFYSLGDFYFDVRRREAHRDWSFMVRANVDQGRISQVDVIPYERVQNELVPLGAARDADAHMSYLNHLSAMIASAEFPAYWQQLATDLMTERYMAYFRNLFPECKRPGGNFVAWLKEALRTSFNAFDYFGTARFSPFRKPDLALLNVLWCESHRWTVETALAIMGGLTPDLRTSQTKQEIADIRHFQETGRWPGKPPLLDQLAQCH